MSYSYQKGSVKAINGEFGDAEIQRIARELQSLQKAHGYKLSANIRANDRYMSLSIESDIENSETEESLLDLMRDFASWIHKGIRDEYEDRMSDENVDRSNPM